MFPSYLEQAHDLCFLNHDILVELLRSGEKNKIFHQQINFLSEEDKKLLEQSNDIFEWFELTGRKLEYVETLRRTVFQALLSDFLHFIYESLSCSRKEKLTVAYALLRKPIQENLLLLEIMAIDINDFSNKLTENPLALRAKNYGGIEGHTKRIQSVLKVLGEEERFNADYLAQLRYQKSEDGFDGICNKSMHLFTEHKKIKTENMNINQIFSGSESKQTQWHFLYSRLPYLIFYARRLIEHICGTFSKTDPSYLNNIEYRVMAATILWYPNVEDRYKNDNLDKFVDSTVNKLEKTFLDAGKNKPSKKDILRVKDSGVI
ncbi:hypothetical protein [Thalassomonas actiniarum]|uniref:Uncharacterized protein n=1 Tax=Thalassomonas actiniarum TaxID=485447 RepID=A0AAF0C2N6_9GAMM|nr:hypothetical protein [Thalassomonas actiniarum]WDE00342.1 hypothetical protein SG35_006790 [Thalassomonas actiniarum]